MASVSVHQRPNESVEQVLRRAMAALRRAVAPDRRRAFVRTFRENGYSPASRMSMYEGTVCHPCTIRHRHSGCGYRVLGSGFVFVYWWKPQEEDMLDYKPSVLRAIYRRLYPDRTWNGRCVFCGHAFFTYCQGNCTCPSCNALRRDIERDKRKTG